MNEIYLVIMGVLSVCLYYILKNRLAIFFPSFPGMIRIIEEFADVKKGDVVYDLGSGDGRVLEAFAGKVTKRVGIEHSRFLNKLAIRRFLMGSNNIEIIQGENL